MIRGTLKEFPAREFMKYLVVFFSVKLPPLLYRASLLCPSPQSKLLYEGQHPCRSLPAAELHSPRREEGRCSEPQKGPRDLCSGPLLADTRRRADSYCFS